ncbi:hypothetical protein BpHYR1_031907 [Brachionus plicatilis]|uniref:Uncharacterized protein n=1 Tax=Brachionus plicatilis TaxID=10195 RepID=A0A3M7R9U3_BRAPC|nr:hypothetical protein BpHYR1_031907 [Brachionus plicatilis]
MLAPELVLGFSMYKIFEQLEHLKYCLSLFNPFPFCEFRFPQVAPSSLVSVESANAGLGKFSLITDVRDNTAKEKHASRASV